MKWEHKCSLEWLRARQKCLTATDIKDLLPFTATGRARKITEEDYIKVFSHKMALLTEDNCYSFGAAARGHILEPYAVQMFNNTGVSLIEFKHWDDVVIKGDSCLGFSPDACNINQPIKEGLLQANDIVGLNRILEIKSYGVEKHILKGRTPQKELEERWQLATAMAVCEDICAASIVFYNPSVGHQMFIAAFDRFDLKDEIETVLEIEHNYKKFLEDKLSFELFVIREDPSNEIKIIEYEESNKRLDP